MLIRPTSIIIHSLVEGDLRQFTHSLNQEQITDTDGIILITHKGQLTQINRKDLSDGMSPWSAYHRDWLTEFTLDLNYLRQGITWYREVDNNTGSLNAYYFKASQDQTDSYNELLAHYQIGLSCVLNGRYIQLIASPLTRGDGGTPEGLTLTQRSSSHTWEQAVSRLLWLVSCYGNIQQVNGVCTALKINLAITGYTRLQMALLQEDCAVLRAHGLFVQWYLVGTGMKQNLELVTNDAELIQLLLSHLQYIDSSITMTTFDTLQSRSAQVIELWLSDQPLIVKPRILD
jgi:hypothetical protein